MPVDTTVDGLLKKITVAGSNTKKVYNSSGKEITGSTKLSTGCVLKTDKGSYTISVNGDLNGDGIVNMKDLVNLKKFMLGSESLSTAAKNAARPSGSTSPNMKDLLMIKKYLLGSAKL